VVEEHGRQQGGSGRPGFDPGRDVRLTPATLRALAHPLRVRLLGLLRADGPSTASRLGERLGESSGSTSYHLRQLAAHGLVVPDERPVRGRERWWQAGHRSTVVEPGDLPAEEGPLLVEYLRAVAAAYSARTAAWLDQALDADPAWADSWTLSDTSLRLTPAQATELDAEITRLTLRYPRADEDAPAGPEAGADPAVVPGAGEDAEAVPVVLQWQLFPRPAVGRGST